MLLVKVKVGFLPSELRSKDIEVPLYRKAIISAFITGSDLQGHTKCINIKKFCGGSQE